MRATSCCAATQSRPLLPPRELFVPVDEFFGALKAFARIDMRAADAVDADNARAPTRTLPPLAVDRRAADPLAALKRFIAHGRRRASLICAESAGRRETMPQFFAEYGLQPGRRATASQRSSAIPRSALR